MTAYFGFFLVTAALPLGLGPAPLVANLVNASKSASKSSSSAPSLSPTLGGRQAHPRPPQSHSSCTPSEGKGMPDFCQPRYRLHLRRSPRRSSVSS